MYLHNFSRAEDTFHTAKPYFTHRSRWISLAAGEFHCNPLLVRIAQWHPPQVLQL